MANDYPVNIPSYADVADIQKALYLYHYGIETEPDDNYEIQENSMAGYIRDTITALEQAQNRLSVVPPLGSSENLNDVLVNGVYVSVDSPTLGYNYPSTTRGILSVISDENNTLTFQTYQTVPSTNNFWWRSGILSGGNRTWSSWSSASKVGHTHDDRYYTQPQMNAKLNTSLTANTVAIVDDTGKVSSSPIVSSSELNQLEGISIGQTIQDQLDDKAASSHNHNDLYYTKNEVPKIYVQSSTPSGASVGDLWFW